MKQLFAALALSVLVACGSNVADPSAIPSPSPSPSSTPTPPTIDVQLTVDVIDAFSRQLIFTADHGQEFVLKASVQAFDRATHQQTSAPFIQDYSWSNYSDPFVGCGIFAGVTTDHPHGKCIGDGYFIFRAKANGYDGVAVGLSALYSLPIGAAASGNGSLRMLSDEEAAEVLARFGEAK